uniref:Calcium-binding mitochondrial carrier protein SCaMC-1-like n=1 Tax=Dermatophagoides pteronyssinus TaxID=6956 RepID=A0A6P6YJT5_DERPT|nr:calcium-binding mitochondrial carrier protein SCaMC-1-like [Dermatophagoides pteronyssinus]
MFPCDDDNNTKQLKNFYKNIDQISIETITSYLPIMRATCSSSSSSSSKSMNSGQNEQNLNQNSGYNNNDNTTTTNIFRSPFSSLLTMEILRSSSSNNNNNNNYSNNNNDTTTTTSTSSTYVTASSSFINKTTTATTTGTFSTELSLNDNQRQQEFLTIPHHYHHHHHQSNINSLNILDVWTSRLNQLFLPSLSIPSISIFTIKSILPSHNNQVQQRKSSSSSINLNSNNNNENTRLLVRQNNDSLKNISLSNSEHFNNNQKNYKQQNFLQQKASTITTTNTKANDNSATTLSTTSKSLLYPSNQQQQQQQQNSDIYNNNSCNDIGEKIHKKYSNKIDDQQQSSTLVVNAAEEYDIDQSEQQQQQQQQQHRFYFDEVINDEEEQIEDYDDDSFTSENYLSIFHSPQYKQLTLADKQRLERLFKEIDVDGNGVIDFNDLLQALEQKGIQATHENVKHLILRSDINLDGDIDFAEFVSYCLENEKQLHVIFKDIDINSDGKLDAHELVLAFKRAGITVDEQEAVRLVRRIKADSSNPNKFELNFSEFRDYLLLHPTDSLHDLMRSWRFGTFVDFGEDGIMPVDFSETEIKTGMWWRHMLAGGVAGAVSRTSTAPLDRLKVFLQVRGAEFNGLGVCLKHMLQEGGVLSLWRGNGINVLKIAPETAMKFMAFDQLKRLIHSGDAGTEITIMERFLAGSIAGAVSQTAIYPMEVLKTRFCLRQTGQYRGLFDAAQKIYSNGGIKNFYRGYIPNLIGIIPYAGIDLTIYETLKKTYLKSHSLEDAPVYVCLTCGTVSSTFGQIASYPLALIRTRMQSETGHHRSSMIDMFRTIMRNEGPRGLYRGITANIMKVAPAVSISYVVYEYTRRPLGAIMS